MKKMGLIGLIICLVLLGCTWKAKRFAPSKNTEYVAMLSDPQIRKDFRNMKTIAMNADLYNQNGRVYFSDADTKKLNVISAQLVSRLQNEYHLNSSHYKTHTFIGKNQFNSCYQYYNSYALDTIGKTCHEFPQHFATCHMCNNYINAIHTRRFSMMHATWWDNEKTIDLVDTFKLKNGDQVYMGLELSVG